MNTIVLQRSSDLEYGLNAVTTGRRLRRLILACLLLAAAHVLNAAQAATYCVDTTASSVLTFCTGLPSDCSLRGAITNANNANEGTIQDIRVTSGTYAVPGGLAFDPAGDKDDKTFSISGGWNADCTSRMVNASNTVLSAENGATDGTFSFTGNQKELVVEGLTFQDFNSFSVVDPNCPAFQICPDTDAVRVRFNVLRHGRNALVFAADARLYSVEGNLFSDLAVDGVPPVSLSYYNTESLPIIAFNTFADLKCLGGTGVGLSVSSESTGTTLHHNIVQSSGCTSDLFFNPAAGLPAVTLRNNLYATRTGQAPAIQSNNVISASPGFINAPAGDYRLRESTPASAAINAGLTPVQAIQLGLSFPSQDLDGPAGMRVVGTRADIGAYESTINDASVLLVSTTADSGTGSLRQAIISANANPGSQKIEFNLPGACPQVILLQSPLPDITDSVEIDGYSQPGASANTQSTGSDAQLCVVLTSASATLAQALQVPESAPSATSLIIKGIAFAGTTGFNGNLTVAVRLRGGKDHVVQGNAVGGIGPANIGTLGSPSFGIQIRGVAQNVLIGGPSPEHRNSFGSTTSSAIVLSDATSGNVTGHTIQNNYIGINAAGSIATPIGLNGVFASGTPNAKIYDNVIAAVPNNAAIQISGATTTGYRIRGNRIGMTPYSIATAPFRVDVGIRVSNGAGGNEIGNLGSNVQSNTITNSNQAGVWIDPSAGNGNIVRTNRIYANGLSGVGLGVDLGDLGPLPNDPGDVDGGPNNGQNTAAIVASNANPDGTRQSTFEFYGTAGMSYTLDVYRSPECPGGGRGGNLSVRVNASIVFAPGGNGFSGGSFSIAGEGAPGYLTTLVTNLSTGDTSEVGPCFLETGDGIFANGFQ